MMREGASPLLMPAWNSNLNWYRRCEAGDSERETTRGVQSMVQDGRRLQNWERQEVKAQGQADSRLGVTGQAWEPSSEPPREPLRLWPVCDLISGFIDRCPIGFSQGECSVCVCVCECVTAHVFLSVCSWTCMFVSGGCACVTEPNLGTYLCKVKPVPWHQPVVKASAIYCRCQPRSPGRSRAGSGTPWWASEDHV